MAEIMMSEMMQALKALRQSKVNDVHIRYDAVGDVMYVNIGVSLACG